MENEPIVLKRLFSSITRIKVLSHYFAHPRGSFYIRELIRILGETTGTLPRELVNLEAAGILVSNFLGKQKYYALNQKSPIIDDLRNIFIKTTGIGEECTGEKTGTSGKAASGMEVTFVEDEKPAVVLTADEQVILRAIGNDGATSEDLVAVAELPAAVVQRSLVMLELKGCIGKTKRGLYYCKGVSTGHGK